MSDLLTTAGCEDYPISALQALKALSKLEGADKQVWYKRLKACAHGLSTAHPSLKSRAYDVDDLTTWLDWSAMSSKSFVDYVLGIDHLVFYGDTVIGIDTTLDEDAVPAKVKKLKELQPILTVLGVDTCVVAHVTVVDDKHTTPTSFSLLSKKQQQRLVRGVRSLLVKCIPTTTPHRWCRRWDISILP